MEAPRQVGDDDGEEDGDDNDGGEDDGGDDRGPEEEDESLDGSFSGRLGCKTREKKGHRPKFDPDCEIRTPKEQIAHVHLPYVTFPFQVTWAST